MIARDVAQGAEAVKASMIDAPRERREKGEMSGRSTSWFRAGMRLLALAPAALLLGAAAPDDAPEAEAGEANPAVWSLADEDTRIYLFGTNHILPHGFVWRGEVIDSAIAEADELVLEIADAQWEAKPERIMAMMMLDRPRPILDRVSPEHRRALQIALKSTGAPIEAFNAMETWAVGFILMGQAYSELYADEEVGELTGVEVQLTETFEEAGKPISGVETTPQQIGFFGSLSEEGQRGFLESMVGEYAAEADAAGSMADDVEALEESWVSGDIAGLAAECDSDESFTPEMREILLRRRNEAWTRWLIARLERPGTLLFAVGACHLAGADSVQAMLAARGLETQRVQ